MNSNDCRSNASTLKLRGWNSQHRIKCRFGFSVAIKQQRVIRAIGAILRAYPSVKRVIVTSRTHYYIDITALPGFTIHELSPFDTEKGRVFVEAWYKTQVTLGIIDKDRAAQMAAKNWPAGRDRSNQQLLAAMGGGDEHQFRESSTQGC